jgi:hypothetical protein
VAIVAVVVAVVAVAVVAVTVVIVAENLKNSYYKQKSYTHFGA